MEDWQLALLIAVVVLADIPVLFWLLRHRRRYLAKAREDHDRWRAHVDSDPRLKRFYEAHRRARLRTALAHAVDTLATMAATVAEWSLAWVLVTGKDVLTRFQTGISKMEVMALALGWGALYLTLQLWIFPRSRATLGLRLLGLVAVSPWDGRRTARLPVPRSGRDYRTDRVPEVLVVPREEFEAAWGGSLPP